MYSCHLFLISSASVRSIPFLSFIKSITLPTKVHLVKAMVFPVVMYGCESWTVKRAGHQRIARRDKKAFVSDQCKEIEEDNRMGKTRNLFKKIIDTKGTFHAKMGLIKDKNGQVWT